MVDIISTSLKPNKINVKDGFILLINKPLEWTSFDVVNKIRFRLRHITGLKKIKVGHAGTLDPLASGLLLICCGQATKLILELQDVAKKYNGVITIGQTTPTYDRESTPTDAVDISSVTDNQITTLALKFLGAQEQNPPIFSAIKLDGQKSYNLARRGKTVDLPPRPIEIYGFNVRRISAIEIAFDVHCSKGTYIRSLAHDFGHKLGVGAYLSSLHREAVGAYHVNNAMNLDECLRYLDQTSIVSE